MTINSIYLRRCRKVYVKDGAASPTLNLIATLQVNIESLGFVLSSSLMERLQSYSTEQMTVFYKQLIKDLRELVGAHRPFNPMYPNFPSQVMEASKAQLYFNSILHYLTNKLPVYKKEPRPELVEQPLLQIIELGSKEDFEAIFTQLASARTSLSPQDKLDISWFVAQYRNDILRFLPNEIPSKENLAFIGAQLIRQTTYADIFLDGKIKTATDVLRLAVAISEGDVSLAQPTKFVKFRRSERKKMLHCLENCGDPTEDMLRWKERWKRLGERLHPGDYAKLFPKTFSAFSVLRSDSVYQTFNGKIESRLRERDAESVQTLLVNRPGDLARRLDHLLRLNPDPNPTLQAFRDAAVKVSTPVLLQVLTHFFHRAQPLPIRIFFPKGEVAKVYATPNNLLPLLTNITSQVIHICEDTLLARFAQLPHLGKCYLDPLLVNYLVPFSQRSASKSLRTLVRGSRVPLPDANVLRFFLWWKNGSSRTDIDLSAALYGTEFNFIDVVSYYNLKNFGGHHSGDIVDAPQGAAEFIDLDIERMQAGKIRYVLMSLNSFTAQPYCDLPECFAGWMARTHPNSGEVFEPRTVQDKIDIASNTRICIPLIVDLLRREVIWADIALKTDARWNNVHNNLSGVSLMLRSMTGLVKMNLHQLFSLHVKARGELVDDKSLADTVFSVSEGITPYDIPRIANEFL